MLFGAFLGASTQKSTCLNEKKVVFSTLSPICSCCEYIWELERYLVACRQQETNIATQGFGSRFKSRASKEKRQREIAELHDAEEEYANMLQQLAPGGKALDDDLNVGDKRIFGNNYLVKP